MGLAYRVYLLAAKVDPVAASAVDLVAGSRSGGGRIPGAAGTGGSIGLTGVGLATALQPSYRVYLDPPALQVCAGRGRCWDVMVERATYQYDCVR